MGSFSHAGKAQSFLVILLGENRIDIKSLTMVLNGEFYGPFLFLQKDVNKGRLTMLGNIVKGFLQDPINDGLHGIGNFILLGIDLRLHPDGGVGFLKFAGKPV